MAQKSAQTEYDSVYFLKILLYLVLASTWVSFDGHKYLPLGLLVGLIIIQRERFQIDRKIEYAILLIGAVLGLVGIGINLAL
jgi:hypothetical protein